MATCPSNCPNATGKQYHLRRATGKQVRAYGGIPPPKRFFSLVQCRYLGSTVDLRGKEIDHPELVNETDSGYPYCRKLGREAVEHGIDSFYAPSARKKGGTYVPVFTRSARSSPYLGQLFSVGMDSGELAFEARSV